jgi:Spy/CpxP family protein refolding chaperone
MMIKPWLRRTLIGLFGATVLFAGIGAYAHREYGWHGTADPAQMKQQMVERIGSRLALNDAQKARLGVLADSLLAQRAALTEGADPKAEVQSLVTGPTFDRARAGALLSNKIAVLQTGGPAVLTAMADFYDGLDPAQQVKVREFLAQHHRHGERDAERAHRD